MTQQADRDADCTSLCNNITNVAQAVQDLDARIAAQGLAIWIGGEPTFTDRFSQAPEWVSDALGATKNAKARELVRNMATAMPNAVLLRTVGRQYPNESVPRWNLGILSLRNGDALWQGPPDPSIPTTSPCAVPADPSLLRDALEKILSHRGWQVLVLDSPKPPHCRLLARYDQTILTLDQLDLEQLYRPSVHATRTPDTGLHDSLAQSGNALILFDVFKIGTMGWFTVELPGLNNVDHYLRLLDAIAAAALELNLATLAICGYPPPTDRHLCWHTVSPDPGVVEIGTAPAMNLLELLHTNQIIFAAAAASGLHPYRLHYNGREVDSGGGGQMTVGGPTPDASPFFLEPQLLPRLVRYFNHHPALSYWFTSESVGSGSQAPRADEGPRERWLELAVALEQVERRTFPGPTFIWSTLAPVLVDSTGNSHRSEINIEKLWNPYLSARGCLGLVEIRPLRMAQDPLTFTAVAALLRAIIARLMQHPFTLPLIDWGDALHGRFALPYYLTMDLQQIFVDLHKHGFGLDNSLTTLLLSENHRKIDELTWQGVNIRVSSALEFWPLVGDVSAQQQNDSRLIDPSTSRLELRLSADTPDLLADWSLEVNNFAVPLAISSATPQVRVIGIRYRSFVPQIGLHPHMPALDRVVMVLKAPTTELALVVTLTEWRPQGGAYPGLPTDVEDARLRRKERLTTKEVPIATLPPAIQPLSTALSDMCFDLRRV